VRKKGKGRSRLSRIGMCSRAGEVGNEVREGGNIDRSVLGDGFKNK
jgi:hypothetical protein